MYQNFIEERRKLLKKFGIPASILIALGLLVVIFDILGMIIVALGIVLLIVMSVVLSGKLNVFRETLLQDVLKIHFTDVTYNGASGVSRHQVSLSELLPRTDRFSSNDLIEAKYDDVNFRMSDVLLQEVRQSGKERRVVTVFQGPFMQIDFNKDFNGKLIVQEDGRINIFSQYKKVKMESIEFNKKFNTYSTHDHTAFYILTPHLMERLLRIESERRGDFFFSFINGTLYIALDNRRDNFSINMFGRIDESISQKFERELRLVKDIIDEMKLNDKIFGKGE